MKIIVHLIFFGSVLLYGCYSTTVKKEYPEEIVEKGLEEKYDLAKWTLYKIYGVSCARSEFDFKNNDHPLGNSFDFYEVDTLENIQYFTFFFKESFDEPDFLQCGGGIYWYTIGFQSEEVEPIRMGGSDYVEFDYIGEEYPDSIFFRILCENKDEVDEWLLLEMEDRKLGVR